jgi:hypothetical protein
MWSFQVANRSLKPFLFYGVLLALTIFFVTNSFCILDNNMKYFGGSKNLDIQFPIEYGTSKGYQEIFNQRSQHLRKVCRTYQVSYVKIYLFKKIFKRFFFARIRLSLSNQLCLIGKKLPQNFPILATFPSIRRQRWLVQYTKLAQILYTCF